VKKGHRRGITGTRGQGRAERTRRKARGRKLDRERRNRPRESREVFWKTKKKNKPKQRNRREIKRERQADGARENLKAGASPSAFSREFSAKGTR